MYDQTARDKLSSKGAASLSDVELLQVIVGSGGTGNDFKQIAKNLNAVIAKVGAENLTVDDVKTVKGVGEAKAALIFAALEFFRRKFTKQTAPLIDTPSSAAEQFSCIRGKRQEYFSMLTLDGARRLIDRRTITVGTLMSSLVHPREVFAPAIEDREKYITALTDVLSKLRDITGTGSNDELLDAVKKLISGPDLSTPDEKSC